MQSLKRVFTFPRTFASAGTLRRTASATSSARRELSLSAKHHSCAVPPQISKRSGILIPCVLAHEIGGILSADRTDFRTEKNHSCVNHLRSGSRACRLQANPL